MIVTTGKHIRVETAKYVFHCTAETPGLVSLTRRPDGSTDKAQHMNLPANKDEAERFIEAYRRTINEDVKYREVGSE